MLRLGLRILGTLRISLTFSCSRDGPINALHLGRTIRLRNRMFCTSDFHRAVCHCMIDAARADTISFHHAPPLTGGPQRLCNYNVGLAGIRENTTCTEVWV
jgi:hypothetical protein